MEESKLNSNLLLFEIVNIKFHHNRNEYILSRFQTNEIIVH